MSNPLTKSDLSTARAGLYEANACLEECDRCEACQLEVAEQRARAQHLKGFWEGVIREFGNNYPAPSSSAT